MGKFTIHFTKYLKDAVIEGKIYSERIYHSTASAKYLYEQYYGKNNVQNYVVETVGMAILSHHSGLQNFVQLDQKPSDYLRRVANKKLPFYDEVIKNFESIKGNIERVERLIDEAVQEFEEIMMPIKSIEKPLANLNHMQKIVFSCKIDANRTNTSCFEETKLNKLSNNVGVFQKRYKHLMDTVAALQDN